MNQQKLSSENRFLNTFLIAVGCLVVVACDTKLDQQTSEELVVYSQDTINVDSPMMPKELAELQLDGELLRIHQGADTQGDYFVVLTKRRIEKASHDVFESTRVSQFISAYLFRNIQGEVVRQWHIMDHVLDCSFDLILHFLKDTPIITDLNEDGIHEFWFVYQMTCTSDVSSYAMKIIMYENGVKHAMRGTAFCVENEPLAALYLKNQYALDRNFNSRSALYPAKAIELWEQYKCIDYSGKNWLR